MDDNAKRHTAKMVMNWRAKKKIPCIRWPAQSPDLNPIENLWSILKRKISARRHKIRNIEEMQQVVQEEWAQLAREEVRKCTSNMHKRIAMVRKNKSGPTKY